VSRDAAHAKLTALLARALGEQPITPGPAFPCPYLPGREAQQVTVMPQPLAPGVYHALMDLNFRRLGPTFYRPTCADCDACRMIRVPVAEFQPTRAQRRCRSRNSDLTVTIGPPTPTDEKWQLYRRYLETRHDGQMDGSKEELEGFLYTSPLRSFELTYRDANERLVGVGIADAEPRALSAVYFFFDPDVTARSPGVFNVLTLIDLCRDGNVPHLYLGYYVRDCAKMSYKAGYRPSEVLERSGWVRQD
jgi:arginyl-tRNA--protein-N-Asp/Glu arginylyltransferase